MDGLPDNIVDNLQLLNNYVVQLICKRIAEIGAVLPSDVHRLRAAAEYAAGDMAAIEREIARITERNLSEVQAIFAEAARENADFANTFYRFRGLAEISAENRTIQALVSAIARRTEGDMRNISKTTMIGFRRGRQIIPLREYYISTIDRAIMYIQTGTVDYNTAIRSPVREMTRSGLRRVTFESGYSRRLDSQARMNIMEGVHQLNAQMMAQAGQEFGADGYEISAHALCAPDHINIQGKQYSAEAYAALNRKLKRPIGTLGCNHWATPIILGVSEPVYSAPALAELRRQSNGKVKHDGKTYTRYEASQRQRQYETAIRYAQEERDALKAAGDTVGARAASKRAASLRAEYKGFSEATGLHIKPERTRIAKP